ncbi:MAG: portal protein [Alphaproteobacteria bacterium]
MNALSSNTVHYEEMSPTLLAAQPPSTERPAPKTKEWSRIYAHLEGRLQSLRNWRYSWWIYWQVLAQFILPRRFKWLITANTMWRGSPLNNSIIDSTATLAMQTCASGLWTGLTSPSRPWFKLGIALPWVELDADGKAWIEDTEQRVYAVLGQSNFYNAMASAFQDVATFGTAPIIIYEDAEDVIRIYNPCAGEYYLAVGGRLSTDTLMREFTLTVQQIVDMFGLDNCPPEVRERWNEGASGWAAEMVVAHAIEPNSPLAGYGKTKTPVQVVPAHFTFREVYWLRGNNTGGELSRKGFNERPFMSARWSVVSNDAYGRGPGMDALGDVKQVQLETARKAEFIEKLVRPPMGANVEMKNEPSSIRPGEVTYADTTNGKKGFWPLIEVQPQALSPMIQDIEKISARIEKCFFVDLFMAITRMEGVQPRNELELSKRDIERLQGLGPFITLFETEVADPALTRIMAIMQRRKMLKPMPPSLQKVPLKLEYISILRLAQRTAESVKMKDFLTTGGAASAAAKAAGLPDPLRIVNLDKWYRRYGEVGSLDPALLFTDDEVQRHDAEHAQQVQGQQAGAAGLAAVGAAKSLSETQMGNNSALTALLGGVGRPGGGA